MPANAPFPIQPDLTAIAVMYRNKNMIADGLINNESRFFLYDGIDYSMLNLSEHMLWAVARNSKIVDCEAPICEGMCLVGQRLIVIYSFPKGMGASEENNRFVCWLSLDPFRCCDPEAPAIDCN